MTRLEALGYSGLTGADDMALSELLAQFEETPILCATIDEAIRLCRLPHNKHAGQDARRQGVGRVEAQRHQEARSSASLPE